MLVNKKIKYIVLSLLISILPIHTIFANGVHPGSVMVFSAEAQNISIAVHTVPVVGNMHITIHLADNKSGDPISNAGIQLFAIASSPLAIPMEPLAATPTINQPGWYWVNLPVTEGGNWSIIITLQHLNNNHTFNFNLNVSESLGMDWAIISVFGALFALIFWSAWNWLNLKKRKNGKTRGKT